MWMHKRKHRRFVFALVALIDFISRWFYQDQINKALQRLTMLTELSGISLPELLTESVSEETNANVTRTNNRG